MIVLDTNVLSELIRPVASDRVVAWLDAQIPDEVVTTAISKAEMLVGIAILDEGKRRDQLSALVSQLFAGRFDETLLTFDAMAAKHFADIVAQRRKAGQPIGTMDAQIASIARARGASIATRDIDDFSAIDLSLINPWEALPDR